jgi:hypothetical protein
MRLSRIDAPTGAPPHLVITPLVNSTR